MSKQRTWAIIAVLAVLVVVGAGWYFAIAPQKSQATTLRGQVATEQQANAKLQGQLAVLRQEEKQVPLQQASIAAAQKRVPAEVGLPAYVRSLSADAAAAHVELVSVAPAAPAPVTLATPAPAAPAPSASASANAAGANKSAASAPPLTAITVGINVVGDYFAVQQFLSKLEHESRITVVSVVDLKPGQLPKPQDPGGPAPSAAPSANSGPDWHTLSAQITATIFMTSGAGIVAPAATSAPSPAPSASASK